MSTTPVLLLRSPLHSKRIRHDVVDDAKSPPLQRQRNSSLLERKIISSPWIPSANTKSDAKLPFTESSNAASISSQQQLSSDITLPTFADSSNKASASRISMSYSPLPSSSSSIAPGLMTGLSTLPSYSPCIQPDISLFATRAKPSPTRLKQALHSCPPTPMRRAQSAISAKEVNNCLTIFKLDSPSKTLSSSNEAREENVRTLTEQPTDISRASVTSDRSLQNFPVSAIESPSLRSMFSTRAADLIWLEKIGEGSYSEVYKCIKRQQRPEEDNQMGDSVFAIKRSKRPFIGVSDRQNVVKRIGFLTTLQADIESNRSGSNENQSTAISCWHSNLVRHFEVWQESGGHLFILTEYCAGGDLTDYFHRNSQYRSEDDVWRLIEEISSALHYMHLRQLLHMDVSLGNILVDESGTFKLSDLGSVVRLGEFVDGDEGDGAFVSPEVLTGIVGQQSDVYSLSMVAYASITAQTVHRRSVNDSPFTRDEPLDYSHSLFEVSDKCKLFIDQMTLSDRHQRPILQYIIMTANRLRFHQP